MAKQKTEEKEPLLTPAPQRKISLGFLVLSLVVLLAYIGVFVAQSYLMRAFGIFGFAMILTYLIVYLILLIMSGAKMVKGTSSH